MGPIYRQRAVGNCAAPGFTRITSAADCAAAAAAIGLYDTTATIVHDGVMPRGCVYLSVIPGGTSHLATARARLHYNRHPDGGGAARDNFLFLCRK